MKTMHQKLTRRPSWMLINKIRDIPHLGMHRYPAIRLLIVLAQRAQADYRLLLFHGRLHRRGSLHLQ